MCSGIEMVHWTKHFLVCDVKRDKHYLMAKTFILMSHLLGSRSGEREVTGSIPGRDIPKS